MQSNLAKFQAQSAMSDDELLAKKAQAWRDKVALVVTFNQLATLGNKEFETCMNIGKKLYEQGIK